MSEKPTLVLVPGLLCDREVWSHQEAHLQDLCRIMVADFTDCSTLEDVMSQVIDQAPATFALAGHSMGGWIAMEIVRRHPDRVSKLCLLDTTVETDSPTVRERRLRMVDDAKAGKIADVIEGIIQAFVIQREAEPAIRKMFLRNQGRFIFQEELMLARQECLSIVSQSPPSPLLIVGSEDHGFYPFMMNLHAMMPTSSLSVIEGSGHMTTMEKPMEVTSLMRKWLAVSLA